MGRVSGSTGVNHQVNNELLTEHQHLMRARILCVQIINNPEMPEEQLQNLIQQVRIHLQSGKAAYERGELEKNLRGLRRLNFSD